MPVGNQVERAAGKKHRCGEFSTSQPRLAKRPNSFCHFVHSVFKTNLVRSSTLLSDIGSICHRAVYKGWECKVSYSDTGTHKLSHHVASTIFCKTILSTLFSKLLLSDTNKWFADRCRNS